MSVSVGIRCPLSSCSRSEISLTGNDWAMSEITCCPSVWSVKETCEDNSNAGWQQTTATYGRADQFAPPAQPVCEALAACERPSDRENPAG